MRSSYRKYTITRPFGGCLGYTSGPGLFLRCSCLLVFISASMQQHKHSPDWCTYTITVVLHCSKVRNIMPEIIHS